MNRSILIRNSVVYQSHTKMFGQIFEYCVPGSVGGQYAEPELIHEAHQIMRRTVNFWENEQISTVPFSPKYMVLCPCDSGTGGQSNSQAAAESYANLLMIYPRTAIHHWGGLGWRFYQRQMFSVNPRSHSSKNHDSESTLFSFLFLL